MEWRRVALLLGFAVLSIPAEASAQHPRDVEEITRAPIVAGKDSNAAVPLVMAEKNWRGTDGSGCCVVASNKMSCNFLGIPEVGDEMKRLSKLDRGGHHPQKLHGLFEKVREKYPDFAWQQFWDSDDKKLDEWNKKGWPIGITYGTGRPYSMLPIAHMVLLTHIDEKWGQILDNNFVEQYSTMPRPELIRRWNMMGPGWMVVITSKTPPKPILPGPLPQSFDALIVIGAIVYVAFLIAFRFGRRNSGARRKARG
jgi:hypothetical protein